MFINKTVQIIANGKKLDLENPWTFKNQWKAKTHDKHDYTSDCKTGQKWQ